MCGYVFEFFMIGNASIMNIPSIFELDLGSIERGMLTVRRLLNESQNEIIRYVELSADNIVLLYPYRLTKHRDAMIHRLRQKCYRVTTEWDSWSWSRPRRIWIDRRNSICSRLKTSLPFPVDGGHLLLHLQIDEFV